MCHELAHGADLLAGLVFLKPEDVPYPVGFAVPLLLLKEVHHGQDFIPRPGWRNCGCDPNGFVDWCRLRWSCLVQAPSGTCALLALVRGDYVHDVSTRKVDARMGAQTEVSHGPHFGIANSN